MDTSTPHPQEPLEVLLQPSAAKDLIPSPIFEAAAESNLHCFCLLQLIELEPDQKDFVVLFVNQKLVNLLQLDRSQILGSRLSKIYPFSDNWIQCDRYFQAYETGQAATEEFPLQIFGETRWYRHEVVPIAENQLSITAEDITSRKAMQKQLVRKAYFDDLTGLKNRTALMEYLERGTTKEHKHF
jgi:PAS domain-containing protein